MHSGSTTNGSLVVQWANPGPDGFWELSPKQPILMPWNGNLRMFNPNSGLCLGIAADGNAGIWNCTGGSDQQWVMDNQYTDNGTGLWLAYYTIVNGDGHCLGVAGNSGTQGAQVVAGPCVGGNLSQGWACYDDQARK